MSSLPLVLLVLDGWGLRESRDHNAIALAKTPVYHDLLARYPHASLIASGEAVGLPAGQMGNSEVGHMNMGAGRVVYQDLTRIDKSIRDGDFFTNAALVAAMQPATDGRRALHLIGLVSDGGVHSHQHHLHALVRMAKQQGVRRLFVHVITDGRDTSPTGGIRYVAQLQAAIASAGVGRIATIVGRYYAMDRDNRWERTERAVDALCGGDGEHASDPVAAVKSSYRRGTTDEFIEPIVLSGRPRIARADAAIFFNFRPDRGRQLAQKLVEAGIDLTTMTRYSKELDVPVAFGEQIVANTLAQALAAAGARQLHMAETEKYAHVTYFFNGGVEREWPEEVRLLVPSPRDVPSYDHKPAMSARELAASFAAEVGNGYRFAVINFANPDMVGHTGSIPAVTTAVEVTDECLGVVVEATHAAGGICLVTADHGNAEQMLEADGVSPHTAHTTNPVPLVVTSGEVSLKEGGELSDLAPTALRLLGLDTPSEMTGDNLCTAAKAGPSIS